jgi:hypothetical protein
LYSFSILRLAAILLDGLGQPQNSRQLAGISSLIPFHSHGARFEGLALVEAKFLIRVAFYIPSSY